MPLVRHPDGGGASLLLMEYGDGRHGPPEVAAELMANIHLNATRPDDVLLCSYPKTGCHWVWEMTRMLRAGRVDIPVVEKEGYMLEYTSAADLQALPSPRTLNTHFLFHQMPQAVQQGRVPIVFVSRHPKDTAVSFFHHHSKFTDYEYSGAFPDYLSGLFLPGKTDFGGLFDYYNDWEKVFRDRPDLPVFKVTYEDLQDDPLPKVRALAQFLGCPADDDLAARVVSACSFGNMRARKGGEWTTESGEPIMYRKGKVGDWKNHFTVTQSEHFDRTCREKLEPSSLLFKYL